LAQIATGAEMTALAREHDRAHTGSAAASASAVVTAA
jgi:hypothetical protein